MADYITYKLTGADKLSATFKTLSQELQRQVVVPAAKDAMDIVLEDARDRAYQIDNPETPQNIALNIMLIEDKKFFEETGSTKVSVGVKKNRKGRPGGNTFYWWFVELGTSRSRSQPFLRNALRENSRGVLNEFISSAKYQIVKLDLD